MWIVGHKNITGILTDGLFKSCNVFIKSTMEIHL